MKPLMSASIIQGIFGRGPRAKLLQWLYLQDGPQSYGARALARHAAIAYGSVDKAVQNLVEDQLLSRVDTEHGPEYRVPYDDVRLAHLFALFRQDSDIRQSLQKALKPFRSVPFACIFGSFASGTTRHGSDIDVLVIEASADDRFAVMTALSKVGTRFSREVSPQFYSADEFSEKLAQGDTIVLSILANPRIDVKGANLGR